MVTVLLPFSITTRIWADTTFSWVNFAGQPGGPGNADGTGSSARFGGTLQYGPVGIAVDGIGNLYVADIINSAIRKVSPVGTNWVVTTIARQVPLGGLTADSAGNIFTLDSNSTILMLSPEGTNWVATTIAGTPGNGGFSDGTGSAALFNFNFTAAGMAADSVGNLYVADGGNSAFRKVTHVGTNWVVTTIAKPNYYTHTDVLAVDSAANLYTWGSDGCTIWKVTPANISTPLAGYNSIPYTCGYADGTNNSAGFSLYPYGLAVDNVGNLYVADQGNQAIRKVTPSGVVTTLAGNTSIDSSSGFIMGGYADGTGSAARFNSPMGVAVDNIGNLYVTDSKNWSIRKITPLGVVTTVAGSIMHSGYADGTGSAARFAFSYVDSGRIYTDGFPGVAVDSAGNLYIADTAINSIRKVSPLGEVTTLAGWIYGAQFYGPFGTAVDKAGNVYVADDDGDNSVIRRVSPLGVVTTIAGSANGTAADGTGSAAQFSGAEGIAIDSVGNLFVSDSWGNTIRKVSPVGANWVVTTIAGSPGKQGFTNGTGSAARFNRPIGVVVDSGGNIYVADSGNNAIRKVSPVGTNWVVTTLAGNLVTNQNGFAVGGSSDGIGSTAQFNQPSGVAVDSLGNVYVADSGNHTIRQVTPAGVVTTIGNVAGVIGGADGVGSSARFSSPAAITMDSAGNLYVVDAGNSRISKGTPSGQQSHSAAIIVLASPIIAGTVSGSGTFTVGTSVQISANANSGWTYNGWSDGNMQNPRTIIVPTDGATYTANFTQPTVSQPSISPNGGTFTSSVSVTLTCATTGVTIYYTTNGTAPTTNSLIYSSPFAVNSTITVKAKSFKSGYADSAIASATFTINTTQAAVATPTITPDGGTFTNSLKVTLNCKTAGTKIHYTIDGTDPTSNSTLYKATGISITNTVTLKAKAFKGTNTSATVAEAYTIVVPLPPTIAIASLPNATAKQLYTVILQVSPRTGFGAFKWSLATGSKLPLGLTLNAKTGVISGKATKTGTFNFTVKVVDARKQAATQALTLTIK